jgi:hypothetical protein
VQIFTRHRTGNAIAVAALLACCFVTASAQGRSTPARIVPAHPSARADGTLGPAARRAISQGYLVPDERAYRRAKATATPRRSASGAFAASTTSPPTLGRTWEGLSAAAFAPSDSTGAVGTSNFIQLVNSQFAIYDKSSDSPLATGPLTTLTGVSASDSVFDVQVIWDATTKRFYYAMDDVANATHNNLAFGFSKTASPDSGSSSDWCKYSISYGSQFPDFPKLGDSKYFTLIGVNVFAGSVFTGADLLAIDKPPSGTSCPSSPDLKVKSDLKTNSSTLAFTPVPANEIDSNGKGWAVARPVSTPSQKLSLFKVTKDDDTGNAKIQQTATNLQVNQYDVPPDAPQGGSSTQVDTADARLTQGVAGVDPNHGDKFTIWTQHTIEGGAGSKVRWYEINPSTPKLIQNGSASSGSLYEFDGAISPNRAVQGSTQEGGSRMLMNFSSSSSSAFPAIRMVSKDGGDSQSSQVLVKQSPGPLAGLDCYKASDPTAPCRWGDYAAATPDPSDKSQIWNVSQWASGNIPTCPGVGCVATWRTQNFIASP